MGRSTVWLGGQRGLVVTSAGFAAALSALSSKYGGDVMRRRRSGAAAAAETGGRFIAARAPQRRTARTVLGDDTGTFSAGACFKSVCGRDEGGGSAQKEEKRRKRRPEAAKRPKADEFPGSAEPAEIPSCVARARVHVGGGVTAAGAEAPPGASLPSASRTLLSTYIFLVCCS